MQIKRLILGEFYTNCYILQGAEAGRCVLIDPADGGPEICRTLEEIGTVPEAVLLTHGHFDHILAVPYLQERWPELPVYCHPLDCPRETTEKYGGRVYPTVSAFRNLIHYRDGDEISVGGVRVKVISTPGHTPGSVSLAVEDAIFTGDTLFKGSIGRTDFEGGNDRDMERSLACLAALEGDYRVFPGHDETTTLNTERAYNPYLRKA
ncbi:MAG: MBL fold metallo-hydrolase [Oscillospiraceae bacterium]|jgi:hydroxyacylglutathione hydrolase